MSKIKIILLTLSFIIIMITFPKLAKATCTGYSWSACVPIGNGTCQHIGCPICDDPNDFIPSCISPECACPCVGNAGNSCNANQCGEGGGTINCDGTCSAQQEPEPSACNRNACGGTGIVCNGTCTAPAPPCTTGTISASPNPCSITGLGATTCTSNITWTTTNASTARVCVNAGTGENIFATALNGTQAATGIQANVNYVFTLRNGSDCTGGVLASTTVSATCPVLPDPPPIPTFTCTAPWGTTATLNLQSTNATKYYLRVQDYNPLTPLLKTASPADNRPNNCGVGFENDPDICLNDFTSSNLNVTMDPNKPYSWWIHAGDACGHVSAATAGPILSCPTLRVTFKDPVGNPMPQQFFTWDSSCSSVVPNSSIATSCGNPTPTADCTFSTNTATYACTWVRIWSGNPARNYISAVTPAGYSSLLNTSAGDLYGWPKWNFGQKTLNFVVIPPACTTVYLKNNLGDFGPISSMTPIVGQINWAYSDVLTGLASTATCEAIVTGCTNTINGSCYVSPDQSTTNYRARVDFTPTSSNTCTVNFTLHPPALPNGDTCNGTSSTQTYSWKATAWSACNSCNQTRTVECKDSNGAVVNPGYCTGVPPVNQQTSPPATGCALDGSYGLPYGNCSATCGGGVQTMTCSATCGGTCPGSDIRNCNQQACSAFLKTTGGDVHANQ